MIGTLSVIALVLITACIVSAAKRGRGRRRMGRYIRGEVDEEMAIGTLGAKVVIFAGFDQTVVERTFISSVIARWSLKNVTPSATAGPLLVGIAHGDYTAAEIEEWVENTGSWSEADLVQQEVGRRKIRKVGIFPNTGAVADASVLNNGLPVRTKLGWILTTGQTVSSWAYNLGTGPYATTDPSVDIQGHANLWPR